MTVSEEALRDAILGRVAAGIKGVDLAVEVTAETRCEAERLLPLLERMVAAGEIVEVEYVTPDNDAPEGARLKSFYLPAGTRCRVSGTSVPY